MEDLESRTGTVDRLARCIEDAETITYIALAGSRKIFRLGSGEAPVSVRAIAALLEKGDEVTVSYKASKDHRLGTVIEVTAVFSAEYPG
ncbi:MAG: hypothetical protein H7X91_04590 [Burkholderiales bacterium]|nr:hypothetical protein [Burkholderiales bacterium]